MPLISAGKLRPENQRREISLTVIIRRDTIKGAAGNETVFRQFLSVRQVTTYAAMQAKRNTAAPSPPGPPSTQPAAGLLFVRNLLKTAGS